MAEQIAFDLFEQKLVSKQFVLTIGYDRDNLQGQKYSGEVAIDRYGRKSPNTHMVRLIWIYQLLH
mgnify:CR=1 FL=1